MRVIVLGGTRFIGRASVEELVRAGHAVMVVHRGETEPADLVDVQHLHVARADFPTRRDRTRRVRSRCGAGLRRADSRGCRAGAGGAAGRHPRLVVLSSIDVYRAYSALMASTHTEPLPLDETSPVRDQRYPYRGQRPGMDDYEKLDVEDAYRARGGVALRLPMVVRRVRSAAPRGVHPASRPRGPTPDSVWLRRLAGVSRLRGRDRARRPPGLGNDWHRRRSVQLCGAPDGAGARLGGADPQSGADSKQTLSKFGTNCCPRISR